MSKKYKLSASLFGHSLDVRSVSVAPNNSIISGSRDKTAKFWSPNGINPGYTEVMTYKDQKNFVIAVLYLPATSEYPDGLVVTGSNDNSIYIYKPAEPFACHTFKEHTNAVCCLSLGLAANTFLSGSWDQSGKLWALGQSEKAVATFSGHLAAIWAIIQLQNKQIVTASADKTVGLWTATGQALTVLKGHTDCVRGLVELPELQQFVSVSNDATVRVWSYAGENIETYYGHTNYIYSVAHCKELGPNFLVTSDEDYSVKVWENGINTQSFKLPAQSVWSVACLSHGDIVTGSSDGVVRVFTQDEERYAEAEILTKFDEEVQALTKQSMQEIGGYKVSDLPGREALYDPGKSAGQMKMIREANGVVAYTWVEDGENSHWEKVGEVLGAANKEEDDKTKFEGKSYDFVFSVDVEDGKPPLKLPYNKGQDPYQAANEFLIRNLLPSTYLEQVVDFILKNSKEQFVPTNTEYMDPFTGGARYTPSAANNTQGFTGVNADPLTGGSSYSTSAAKPATQNASSGANADPFTGSSSYTTLRTDGVKYFPINTYKTFEMGDPKLILGKLKEFNQKCGDGNNADESCLEGLISICNNPPSEPTVFEALFKLLDWREDIVFPVLDVVRMAVRNSKNNEIISTANNGSLLPKLLSFINENSQFPNNTIVALRTLCNLFVHEYGEALIFTHRFDIIENISSLGTLNKNGQIGVATFLLNLTISVLKKKDDLGIIVLADVIPDLLKNMQDPEAQFRAYVALGTLIVSAPQVEEVKAVKANAAFLSILHLHVLSASGDLETKRRNCAQQLEALIH